jgi:hypothetical protein
VKEEAQEKARLLECSLCLDRPEDLFNGGVDDDAPVRCPRCGNETTRTNGGPLVSARLSGKLAPLSQDEAQQFGFKRFALLGQFALGVRILLRLPRDVLKDYPDVSLLLGHLRFPLSDRVQLHGPLYARLGLIASAPQHAHQAQTEAPCGPESISQSSFQERE